MILFSARGNETLARRLWANVDRIAGDSCWEYQRADNGHGYGFIRARRSDGTWGMLATSRAAWLVTHGELPAGMLICHTCDNRRCCNPSHPFLGSVADNAQDMLSKGREARGFKLPQTKLSEKQVQEIRDLHGTGAYSQREIGRRFGIGQTHVSRIIRRVRRAA